MEKQEKMTKKKAILTELLQGKVLTALDAFYLCGSMRLAAMIAEIRDDGYGIKTEYVNVKTKYGHIARIARYSLA